MLTDRNENEAHDKRRLWVLGYLYDRPEGTTTFRFIVAVQIKGNTTSTRYGLELPRTGSVVWENTQIYFVRNNRNSYTGNGYQIDLETV